MKSCAIVLLAFALQGEQEKKCDSNLEAWLGCNNPRVVRYLSELSAEHVGTVLPGVELTGGTLALKNHRYLGQAEGLPDRAHVFLFEREGSRLAYAWVDESGDPLDLPQCEGAFPGSAYVLSGDVYTWKALQPGHGVVEVACVYSRWTAEKTK